MRDFICKVKESKAAKTISCILSSKFFPFITALVVTACYYLGWDLVTMYYVTVCALLILFLLEDISPIISVFMFMNIMVSRQNSPSSTVGGSDFYFRTAVLVQVIILIVIFASALTVRTGTTVFKKKFRPTPTFYGLCALAAAFMLNGVFRAGYNYMDLVYGAFMAFFFLVIFVLMKDNVHTDKNLFERIAYSFIALSAVLVLELIVAYLTTEGLFTDGKINRGHLMFGWGVYNTLGMLLVISIPAAMYIAGKHKYGYLFYLYSMVVFAASFLSTSRQAMVGAAIIFPVCMIILLVKGKNRIINLCITGAAVVACVIIACVYWNYIYSFFEKILSNLVVDGKPNGSGRWALWVKAWEEFKIAPIFGTGFYADLPESLDTVGLDIIPLMYHNTVMQLLASCGIVGLAAYVVHRVQTVISFFRNVTSDRAFIALTILALLILNLFDNHLFYILPTLVYSSLVAVLIKSEGEPKKAKAEVMAATA